MVLSQADLVWIRIPGVPTTPSDRNGVMLQPGPFQKNMVWGLFVPPWDSRLCGAAPVGDDDSVPVWDGWVRTTPVPVLGAVIIGL